MSNTAVDLLRNGRTEPLKSDTIFVKFSVALRTNSVILEAISFI